MEHVSTAGVVDPTTVPVVRNQIRSFLDLRHVRAGGSRPPGFDRFQATRLGVLGAGMMGAGIAYVAAQAGIEVVLKDISLAAARRGKAHAERLEAKALARGRTSPGASAALLDRIHPTADPADFAGVDVVVEAVFESVELKHKVFGEIEEIVDPAAVLGSNTSTLPIALLAEGVRRSEDFLGLHFFSPVDRMPLVEIIRGRSTSDATLAKAFDVVRQLGKTPIVVNDGRGFFTSRVIIAFLNEAIAAVGDGIDPAAVEAAALRAGYPAGPLALLDELTLTLPRKIRQEAQAAAEAVGDVWRGHPADAVVDRMIDEFGRPGRSGGAGFYEYDDTGRRGGLWPGLRAAFGTPGRGSSPADLADLADPADLADRLLFAESIEAVHAMDEGVVGSVPDANVGSLLGIGFPPWTGGVFQYINQYADEHGRGPAGFVARARELADRYGARFAPPGSLVSRAVTGSLYA